MAEGEARCSGRALCNTITSVHYDYSLVLSPKKTVIFDTGNYTGKRGIFRILRHLKMSDTESELMLIFGNLETLL